MEVKCHDANRDYVIVTWKPPNTTSESPVIGYFVDKYVNIGIYVILFIAQTMYILEKKTVTVIAFNMQFLQIYFYRPWNSVAYCVKLLDYSLPDF